MPTYMRRIILLLSSDGPVPRQSKVQNASEDWKRLYAATMQEMDAKQLHVLIEKTSRAMEARLDELWRTEGSDEEHKEILVAANALSLKLRGGSGRRNVLSKLRRAMFVGEGSDLHRPSYGERSLYSLLIPRTVYADFLQTSITYQIGRASCRERV